MYKKSIGLIGGFGAYATMDFYRRILEQFKSDSERSFPHIYMDLNFTMPSRTKALLYGTDYDIVVKDIAESLRKMCMLGADYIILVCGTAHAFLDDALKLFPEAKEKVIHIIEALGEEMSAAGIKKAAVIAAEGTLQNHLYSRTLKTIDCIEKDRSEYFERIRYFIELVKQKKLSKSVCEEFALFLNEHACNDIILGCTEFPVLVDYINGIDKTILSEFTFWDPLEAVLEKLKESQDESLGNCVVIP